VKKTNTYLIWNSSKSSSAWCDVYAGGTVVISDDTINIQLLI